MDSNRWAKLRAPPLRKSIGNLKDRWRRTTLKVSGTTYHAPKAYYRLINSIPVYIDIITY